jgi:hypothetical protein
MPESELGGAKELVNRFISGIHPTQSRGRRGKRAQNRDQRAIRLPGAAGDAERLLPVLREAEPLSD